MTPTTSTLMEEDNEGAGLSTEATPSTEYTWRVDLTKTEVYWRGWFEGLSQLILSLPSNISKIIILAG